MFIKSTGNMDWSLCAICQSTLSEPIKCPLDSLQEGKGVESYKSFLKNVSQFREYNSMPVEVKFGSEENVETFVKNRAVWHKTCHIKFSNSKLERVLAKKRKSEEVSDDDRRKSKRIQLPDLKEVCIFCGKDDGDLHQVTTLGVDENVRMMATELQDTVLLAKLAGGDMIATECKYHRKCMTSLKNCYNSVLRKKNVDHFTDNDQIAEGRAFTELVSYMESSVETGINIFQLSELYELYVSRLKDLKVTKSVNKTRLKNHILAHFPDDLQEQAIGRNIVLIFHDGMKSILKNALDLQDFESEALEFAKVAKMIRNDIFDKEGFQFSGNFSPGCQYDCVPPSLMCLVSMLLNRPNIADQATEVSQSCLTIAQLIIFNAKKGKSAINKKTRHSRVREPPLPIYIALNVHTQTRSKKLVDNLYNLGLSVSYGRIDELSNGMATAVCEKFKSEGVVCPPNQRLGLFTVGALDNIDHNPSSTTSQGSFHGTDISVFQFPTETECGTLRPNISLAEPKSNKDFTLPENFSTVPALSFKVTDVSVPSIKNTVCDTNLHVESGLAQEKCWLDHGIQLLDKDLEREDYISWSAYHASLIQPGKELPVISGLLPLFHEKAASISMVKHGMDVLRQVTEYLNPGQIPVIAVDQPLYTIVKYVQWKWPETHGESVYVAMLGGLHIEMALWSLCGDLLESSGWTTALSDSGVASAGTADSFLRVSHLTRTRHAHQVTALSLSKLQRDAFTCNSDSHDEESFRVWRSDLLEKSPTFKFWDMILNLEIRILIFIKAHRERNFQLFVEILEVLAPWFFVLDHINYARWLPVYINDMKSLPDRIKDDMLKFWVIQKTEKRFSSIPIDQAHE